MKRKQGFQNPDRNMVVNIALLFQTRILVSILFCLHCVIFGLIFLAGGIDYSQWREKAQNLFSDEKESLSVTGKKTGIKSDETRTFWSTAPPKVGHKQSFGSQVQQSVCFMHIAVVVIQHKTL